MRDRKALHRALDAVMDAKIKWCKTCNGSGTVPKPDSVVQVKCPTCRGLCRAKDAGSLSPDYIDGKPSNVIRVGR